MQGALGSIPVSELDPLRHAAQLSIRELKNPWAEDIQLLPLSDPWFQGPRSPVVHERALGSYHTCLCCPHPSPVASQVMQLWQQASSFLTGPERQAWLGMDLSPNGQVTSHHAEGPCHWS